ncbi:MAG: hypothetical protein JXR46_05610 [Calditrichaceae bacterium]|nr:hypothetical protein [Calditrichaceae bacterium]MBN2708503.1 hypothetical protein [Calditrichaceae bacterium]RQV96023.1 MAG: hypothetical protein EH224_05865 [Calditrichota bacterium]
MIIIAAALRAEIFPLIERAGAVEKINTGSAILYKGKTFSVLITGIGEQKALKALNEIIFNHHISFVLNAGFAGGLTDTVTTGEVYSISRVFHMDKSKPVIPLTNQEDSPEFLKINNLLTVSQAVIKSSERKSVYQSYGIPLVDMECYGLADFCRKKSIPFSALKIVSDIPGESAHEAIKHRYKLLAGRLTDQAFGYLENYQLI